MYNVIIDPDLRESMSIKGMEKARAFSWKGMAEKTVKVYKEVAMT